MILKGILIGHSSPIFKHVILNELLRTYIRKILDEAWWEESYDKELMDDPAFAEKSMLVPDDIKKKIKKYNSDMGLSTKK